MRVSRIAFRVVPVDSDPHHLPLLPRMIHHYSSGDWYSSHELCQHYFYLLRWSHYSEGRRHETRSHAGRVHFLGDHHHGRWLRPIVAVIDPFPQPIVQRYSRQSGPRTLASIRSLHYVRISITCVEVICYYYCCCC